MSDDEAFIRAVVDGRGDDTPRLVYADWLDDQSDPRAPYLRAELEWAKSGKGERKLRALAGKLDAVWVARVTRPPLGVCCDQIVVRFSKPHTTAEALDAAEATLNLTFPAEYRALLLNHNGGHLAYGQPPDVDGRSGAFSPPAVGRLCPLRSGPAPRKRRDADEWDVVEAAQFAHSPTAARAGGLKDYVPFATAGEDDLYLLGARGKAAGRVGYFHDFTHNARDPSHLLTLVKSLGAFLASITEEAPEWWRHACNGDTDELCAWLDAGGDPNVKHPHPNHEDDSPLLVAVLRDDTRMVRELVARGARPDAALRSHLRFMNGPSTRKVREALVPPKKGKKK